MLDHFSHCKELVRTMLLYTAHLCQLRVGSFSSSKILTVLFHKACTAFRASGTMMQHSQFLCKCLPQTLQPAPVHLVNRLPQLIQLPVHYLEPAALATTETESVGLRLLAACGQHCVRCGHQICVLQKNSLARSRCFGALGSTRHG